MIQSNNKIAVLSLSGGMDSTSLMLHLLRQGYEVYAVSFNYGQKHSVELERAKKNIEYLAVKGYVVKHKIVDLTSAMGDFKSSLTSKEIETPEGFYAEENMKATVVPNRNAIFSSIVYGQALSLSIELNKDAVISLGIHAGDHCFSRDTKIMTPRGIVNFEELKVGDRVYSYNFETNKLEEDILTAIHKKNIVQQINCITTSAGDIKLTDEHSVFRVKLSNFHPVHGYDKTFEKVKVKELAVGDYMVSSINAEVLKPTLQPALDLSGYDLESNRFVEPNNEMLDLLPIVDSIALTNTQIKVVTVGNEIICLSNGTKLKPISRFVNKEAFLRVVAWYITEGWTNVPSNPAASKYSSGISQSLKTNLTNVDSIINSLKVANIPYRLQFSKKQFNNRPQEMTVYLSGVISLILQSCGKCSGEKQIPEWLYKELISNKQFIQPFFETMIAGDGHQNLSHISYVSKSKFLIEQMCFLGNILGYGINIIYPKNKKTTYVLNFLSPQNKIASACLGEGKFNYVSSIKREEYNDNVFDITVENNHNFFAGDFGQILISNSIYPDCRQDFRDAIAHAFTIGNWGSERISYIAPYLDSEKYDILKDALISCEILGLDFDIIMANTNTSYSPNEKGESSGKTGADVERVLAFHKLGRKDPVPYADGWDKALEYALSTEQNYNNK